MEELMKVEEENARKKRENEKLEIEKKKLEDKRIREEEQRQQEEALLKQQIEENQQLEAQKRLEEELEAKRKLEEQQKLSDTMKLKKLEEEKEIQEQQRREIHAKEQEETKYIEKVISSKQEEKVGEFRQFTSAGKLIWKNTHFIFAIDCSGSMRGLRWKSVKDGYSDCLSRLQKMKDVYISSFTFDDKPNPYIRLKTPSQALKGMKALPFTGKGTNYERAMEYVHFLCTRGLPHQYLDYLTCVIFLSDGLGGYPAESLRKLSDIRGEGRKILFYTIACATEDSSDMEEMVKYMEGEHYNVSDAIGAKRVFHSISQTLIH